MFGSMARGDAGPESDVDLLVEVGPNPSPWFPGGLVVELEELLGRRVQVPGYAGRCVRVEWMKSGMPQRRLR